MSKGCPFITETKISKVFKVPFGSLMVFNGIYIFIHCIYYTLPKTNISGWKKNQKLMVFTRKHGGFHGRTVSVREGISNWGGERCLCETGFGEISQFSGSTSSSGGACSTFFKKPARRHPKEKTAGLAVC